MQNLHKVLLQETLRKSSHLEGSISASTSCMQWMSRLYNWCNACFTICWKYGGEYLHISSSETACECGATNAEYLGAVADWAVSSDVGLIRWLLDLRWLHRRWLALFPVLRPQLPKRYIQTIIKKDIRVFLIQERPELLAPWAPRAQLSGLWFLLLAVFPTGIGNALGYLQEGEGCVSGCCQ